MSLPLPALLEAPRSNPDAVAGEVVEHDDVGARLDGLVGLGLALHLDLDLHAEARDGLGGLDGVGDAAPAPDVVVLEHDHGAEVHAVRVGASDQHSVLLNQAEPGRRLSRAGDDTPVSGFAGNRHQPLAPRSDAGAPRKRVQGNALAEEDAADGAPDGGDAVLAAGAQVDGGGLVGVPLDGAAALGKDLVEEGPAGDDAGGLPPEGRDAGLVADDEAGVVERGGVLGEPRGDGGLPRGGEEVCEVSLRLGHFRVGSQLGWWGKGKRERKSWRWRLAGLSRNRSLGFCGWRKRIWMRGSRWGWGPDWRGSSFACDDLFLTRIITQSWLISLTFSIILS